MTTPFQDLFIFEMANNHQGSVEHGRRIIDAMAQIAERHGIRAAVKFQYRDLDSFIHPDYREREDVAHIPRFLSTRLDDGAFQALVAHVRDRALLPVITPFDEASVRKAADHGSATRCRPTGSVSRSAWRGDVRYSPLACLNAATGDQCYLEAAK